MKCHCSFNIDNYGNMEEFHDAADEITEAINEQLGINSETQREI